MSTNADLVRYYSSASEWNYNRKGSGWGGVGGCRGERRGGENKEKVKLLIENLYLKLFYDRLFMKSSLFLW